MSHQHCTHNLVAALAGDGHVLDNLQYGTLGLWVPMVLLALATQLGLTQLVL